MCLQNCVHLSVEETISADESLLVYCKPVQLYNILRHRAKDNPLFLRRCLHYRLQSSRKRRLRDGIVVFNYKDYGNMIQKTEVTEDFSCPFCLMQCASFKGLRHHLSSSHDLFNYEFWVTEDFQAVNVSVKTEILRCESNADGEDLRPQTFFLCSKPRRRKPKNLVSDEKHVQFLELDSPNLAREITDKGSLENGEDDQSCKGDKASKSGLSGNHFQYGKYVPDCRSSVECLEHVGSSFNVPGIAIAQSSLDAECLKSQSTSDLTLPATLHIAKTRKLSVERSDPKNRVLLQKRQFFHSHRVQPMALDQVLSDRDSEDEVDDEIADFEDRRMLDDFVDVTKDEKHLMHLWNSFVRKQRVLADGHVPWACEAFSKLHGHALVQSPALFWCWRLFMIKLWNHGLLDSIAMNSCNVILEGCRKVGEETIK